MISSTDARLLCTFTTTVAVATCGALYVGLPTHADDAIAAGQARVASDIAKVEDAYLVGPTAAAKLDCVIAWQANVPVPTDHALQAVWTSPDGVLALNSRNELSFVRAGTGDRAWTAAGAQKIDKVIAARILGPSLGLSSGTRSRIAVCSDTAIYQLDSENGATLKRTPTRHLASTLPVFAEGMAIFGSRGGSLVWVNGHTGFVQRAAAVDRVPMTPSPIAARPATDGNTVVAASSKGTVGAFDTATGTSFWRKDLLGGVVASPVIANGIVFVASEDQHLYAFDLSSGTTLWRYFTESPLTTKPFAVTGTGTSGLSLVLQEIPTEGLVAFTQNPEGQLAGEVRWKRASGDGDPVTVLSYRNRDAVALWSPATRTMTFVGLDKGDTLGTLSLPKAEHLVADSMERGGFVIWSGDGRIERLSPMPQAPVTAKTAPSSEGAASNASDESASNG